jgi:hypothetical protein
MPVEGHGVPRQWPSQASLSLSRGRGRVTGTVPDGQCSGCGNCASEPGPAPGRALFRRADRAAVRTRTRPRPRAGTRSSVRPACLLLGCSDSEPELDSGWQVSNLKAWTRSSATPDRDRAPSHCSAPGCESALRLAGRAARSGRTRRVGYNQAQRHSHSDRTQARNHKVAGASRPAVAKPRPAGEILSL